LRSLESKEPVRRWYKLYNESGASDGINRGEVELALVWQFNPAVRAKVSGLLSRMGESVFNLVKNESDEEVADEEGDVSDSAPSTGHSLIHYTDRNLWSTRPSSQMQRQPGFKKRRRRSPVLFLLSLTLCR
jgi:hypothetical protein